MLRLEEQPESAEIIADIFREAHSLKGSAQMLGFVDISQIAHQLEDLFVAAKRDARLIDARAFDLVFRTLDVIAARVEELARGRMPRRHRRCRSPVAAPAADPRRRPSAACQETRRPRDPAHGFAARVRSKSSRAWPTSHRKWSAAAEGVGASRRAAAGRVVARAGCAIACAKTAWRRCTRSRAAELGDYADALDAINRRMRRCS